MAYFGHFATFPVFPTEVVQIDSEWPILDILQIFQYFPTEVVQIDSEWTILAVLQLFQYFPAEVVQNNSEWPILAIFSVKKKKISFNCLCLHA